MRAKIVVAAITVIAIILMLALSTLQSTEQTSLAAEHLPAPLAQSCTTYTSVDVPKAIPDNNLTGVTSNLVIPPIGYVYSVSLSLSYNHPRSRDLRAYLTQPNLCQSQIFTSYDLYGANGAYTINFANNGIGTLWEYGHSPWDDTYKPYVPFGSNVPAGGRWQLKMVDASATNTGSLTGWSLTLCTSPTRPTITPSPTPEATETPIPIAACGTAVYSHNMISPASGSTPAIYATVVGETYVSSSGSTSGAGTVGGNVSIHSSGCYRFSYSGYSHSLHTGNSGSYYGCPPPPQETPFSYGGPAMPIYGGDQYSGYWGPVGQANPHGVRDWDTLSCEQWIDSYRPTVAAGNSTINISQAELNNFDTNNGGVGESVSVDGYIQVTGCRYLSHQSGCGPTLTPTPIPQTCGTPAPQGFWSFW